MQRPLHEMLWLSCAEKRCCSVRTVLPTGADIWRIATQMDIPPESFLRTVAAPPNADAGFILARQQPALHAALARRPLKTRASTCVFLIQLGDQASRCGLDGLRPLSCKTFPAVGSAGTLRVDDDNPCTCRAWSLADLDRPHISALLREEAHERQHYHTIIQAWNTRVERLSGNTKFVFGDFCRYLLDAYAQRPPEAMQSSPL